MASDNSANPQIPKGLTMEELCGLMENAAKQVRLNLPANIELDEKVFIASKFTQVKQRFIATKRAKNAVVGIIPKIDVDSTSDSFVFMVHDTTNTTDQVADGVALALAVTSGIEGIVQYRADFRVLDQELRASAVSGCPVQGSGVQQAALNLAERIDKMAAVGDGTRLGLFNAKNTTIYDIPADGIGSSALWSAKTPALRIRDVTKVIQKLESESKGTFHATDVWLPGAHLADLRLTVNPDYHGKSNMDVLQDMFPDVKFHSTQGFTADTPVTVTTTTGSLSHRIVAADLSSDENVAHPVGMEPCVMNTTHADNATVFHCKCRCGGAVVRQLKSVCIGIVSGGI